MFKKLNKMKIGARLKKSFRQIILIFGILSALQNVLLRENGGNFMLTSLGLIFLLGLLMAAICQKIHLPRIIGMLFTGISNTKPRQLS